MNRQQLLSRLGQRGWPVLYATGPLGIWQRGSARWKAAPLLPYVERRGPVLCSVPGRMPPVTGAHPFLERLTLSIFARHLERRLPGNGKRVLYFFGPHWAKLADYVEHDRLVYHAYDSLAYFETYGFGRSPLQQERSLIKRAHAVVASSEQIAEDLERHGRSDIHVVGNGCDFPAFSQPVDESPPKDLEAVPQPRIGYVGRLDPKLDLRLICEVVARRRNWQWVFVGEVKRGVLERGAFGPAMDWLERQPNVHLIGHRPHGELPRYMHAMDALTMPYAAKAPVYPLKMHEYLATGRPVVSTPFPAVEAFAHAIDVRADAEGWMQALGDAIAGAGICDPETRKQVAAENSWDARTDDLEAILGSLLAE